MTVIQFCITIAACWSIWCVTEHNSDNLRVFFIIYTFVHTVLNSNIWYFNDLTVTFSCFNFWISIKVWIAKDFSYSWSRKYTGIWLKVSFLASAFAMIFTKYDQQLWRTNPNFSFTVLSFTFLFTVTSQYQTDLAC